MSSSSGSSPYGGHDDPKDQAMDTREIYRMLVADHFDLLSESEQARLSAVLARQPGADFERFRRELLTALASDEDGARGLAFRHGLETAEAEVRGDVPGRRPRRWRQVWQMVLAAAIGAGLAAAFLGRPPQAPPTDPMAQAHVLTAERSTADDSVDLDASSATALTLVFEARVETESARWELLDAKLERVDQGHITLRGDHGLRTFAVTVAKERLRPATSYWLVFLDEAGTVLRRWAFRTE